MPSSKIKTTIPYSVYEIILKDIEHFNTSKNYLCNSVFEYFRKSKYQYNEKEVETRHEKGQVIQFNLIKDNFAVWESFAFTIQNESSYFREILSEYANRPQHKREKILFKKNFDSIEKAIKEGKKIKIKFNNSIKTVEPYFISPVKNETYNYLFTYYNDKNIYANFKMVNVEFVETEKENVVIRDEEYIEAVKNNFDPFLSQGKEVKVKLTENGKKLLDKFIYNRPKLLREEGDIFVFEASEFRAQLYFRGFLSDVEFIEPVSLRDWILHELESALKNYKK